MTLLSPARRILGGLALAVALGAGLLAFATGPAGAATPTPQTKVVSDCFHYRVRPHKIDLDCHGLTHTLINLHYQTSMMFAAAGYGAMQVDLCKPTCPDGHWKNYAIKFALYDAVGTGQARHFTRVAITFPRSAPTRLHNVIWTIPSAKK
jgi:hypothetical protein